MLNIRLTRENRDRISIRFQIILDFNYVWSTIYYRLTRGELILDIYDDYITIASEDLKFFKKLENNPYYEDIVSVIKYYDRYAKIKKIIQNIG